MEFDFNQQPGRMLWRSEAGKDWEPLVSIVTPYYNGAAHIWQTCRCVLNQTFPYFEWIIVDDGSTREKDVLILQEIAAQDPRIRILHKDNGGISSARNFGIRYAKTDYILPLDCDDLIEPTFTEYCWWMLQKHPGAAWAYTNSVGFQDQEYLWKIPFDPMRMKYENHLTATALIRRENLVQIGGYHEGQKYLNEDWHAWLKMMAKGGYPVQSAGEYLFWYRRNDTGVLTKVIQDKKIKKENRKLIGTAAREIQLPSQPIIYPRHFSYAWTSPEFSDWDRCIYAKKTRTHIAFLFPHLVMGGADKFNLDLISGLDPEKFETSILTTLQSENGWLQEFRKVTPNIFNLANFMDPQDYAEFISYYLKSRAVDILFVSNSFHGYYLLPWLREHFPDLVILDYVHMEEWYWRNGGYARTSSMVAAVTEKTYVCNSATRDVMIKAFARHEDSVQTVHIGVDERFFCSEQAEPGTLYRELDISEGAPVVLFICRLHPQKRPFLMLQIAQQVVKKLPQTTFVVVGEGPLEQELKNAVKQKGLERNVRFAGYRKDVRSYYRDAKVTLICSLKEGLALTAYESCAMGVPVVSADVGGQKDLIDSTVGALIPCLQKEENSLDCRVFSEEEVNNYVSAIINLLTDEKQWKQKSAACREKIENAFTIRNMAAFFQQEFQNMMTDEALRSKRHQISQALSLCRPLAGEFYALEMQHQSAEDGAAPHAESLFSRGVRVLREKGFGAFILGVLSWGKRRVSWRLKRLRR